MTRLPRLTRRYKPAEVLDRDGNVLARVSDGSAVRLGEGLRRFTAFCDHPSTPDDFEEIDVDARRASLAERCAEMELEASYERGMRVRYVEERYGWYM